MTGIVQPYRGILPTIHPSVFIAPTAAVIGDVHIGPETNIWYGTVVRGDVNHIRIGARTNLQDGTMVHVTGGGHATYIGDDITVGHHAILHACTLEDLCFIGMQACVMDGAVVESRAMVAAGALVTPGKRVPSGQLWAGNPARYKRDLTEEEIGYFPVSATKYAKLGQEYREPEAG